MTGPRRRSKSFDARSPRGEATATAAQQPTQPMQTPVPSSPPVQSIMAPPHGFYAASRMAAQGQQCQPAWPHMAAHPLAMSPEQAAFIESAKNLGVTSMPAFGGFAMQTVPMLSGVAAPPLPPPAEPPITPVSRVDKRAQEAEQRTQRAEAKAQERHESRSKAPGPKDSPAGVPPRQTSGSAAGSQTGHAAKDAGTAPPARAKDPAPPSTAGARAVEQLTSLEPGRAAPQWMGTQGFDSDAPSSAHGQSSAPVTRAVVSKLYGVAIGTAAANDPMLGSNRQWPKSAQLIMAIAAGNGETQAALQDPVSGRMALSPELTTAAAGTDPKVEMMLALLLAGLKIPVSKIPGLIEGLLARNDVDSVLREIRVMWVDKAERDAEMVNLAGQAQLLQQHNNSLRETNAHYASIKIIRSSGVTDETRVEPFSPAQSDLQGCWPTDSPQSQYAGHAAAEPHRQIQLIDMSAGEDARTEYAAEDDAAAGMNADVLARE